MAENPVTLDQFLADPSVLPEKPKQQKPVTLDAFLTDPSLLPEEPDKPSKATDIFRGFITTGKTLPLETVGGLAQRTGEAAQQPLKLKDFFGPFGFVKVGKKGFDVLARKAGIPQALKEQGQRISAKAQEIKARPESQPSSDSFSSKFLFGLGGGAATLGASLAAAVASGGNPAVPTIIFSLIKKGQDFGEISRTQPELSFEQRDRSSTLKAITEGGLEFASVGSLLKIFGGKAKTAAVKGLKGALGRAGKAALAEGGTELTQEVADIAIPKIEGISDETFAENGERLALSFLIGSTLGGGASGVFDVARQIGVKPEEVSDEVLTDAIEQTGKDVAENLTEEDEATFQAAQEKIQEIPAEEVVTPEIVDVTQEGIIPPSVSEARRAARILTTKDIEIPPKDISRLEGVELAEELDKAAPVEVDEALQPPPLAGGEFPPLLTAGGKPLGRVQQRRFGTRIKPDLPPEIQESFDNTALEFQSIPLDESIRVSRITIERDNNTDVSIARVLDFSRDSSLPSNIRGTMGQLLIIQRKEDFRRFKAENNAEAAAKASSDVTRLTIKLSEFATVQGRSIQVFQTWEQESPEGFLRTQQKNIERAKEKFIKSNRTKVEKAREGFDKVAKETAGELAGNVRRGITKKPKKEAPGKLAEALEKKKKPAERKPRKKVDRKTVLDRVKKKDIAVWEKIKKEAVGVFRRKTKEAFSIDLQTIPPLSQFAKRLRASLSKELDLPKPKREALSDLDIIVEGLQNIEKHQEAFEEARAAIIEEFKDNPQAFKALNENLNNLLIRPFTDQKLNSFLNQQLEKNKTNIAKMAVSHFATLARVRGSLRDSLKKKGKDGLNLPPGLADTIADELEIQFNRRIILKRDQIVKQIKTPKKVKTSQKKTNIDNILKAARVGALTNANFDANVAEFIGAPTTTPQVAKVIFEKAIEIEGTPAGFQRQLKISKLLDFMKNQEGVDKLELASAFWYASVLASIPTNLVNLQGSVVRVYSEFAIEAALDPGKIPILMASFYQALGKGRADFWYTLKTGQGKKELTKFQGSGILNRIADKNDFIALKAYDFSFRIMLATDMFASTTAGEMKATLLARDLALLKGLDGKELSTEMSEILHNTDEFRIEAEQQADAEGLTGNDKKKRVFEIIDQKRPNELVEIGFDFSREATYNGEMKGQLGRIGNFLIGIQKDAETGKVLPAERLAGIAFFPFIRIATNFYTNALDWLGPVGYAKAFITHGGTKAARRAKNRGLPSDLARKTEETEYYKALTKATVSMVGMAALLLLSFNDLDKDIPRIRINGPGPLDPRKRRFLEQTGWKPWSLQFGTNLIRFQDTPFFLSLGIVGAWSDAVRFGELDGKSAGQRFSLLLQSSFRVLTAPLFLSGLSSMLDVAVKGRGVEKTFRRKFVSIPGRAAVPRVFDEIKSIFDPTLIDDTTIRATFVKTLPAARRLGGVGAKNPVIDVFGDPVEVPFFKKVAKRFVSKIDTDSLEFVLTNKNVFVTPPSKATTFGDRTMTPNEHFEYTQRSGKEIKNELLIIKSLLQRLPQEEVQEEVDDIVREARKNAKEELLDEVGF